MTDTGKASVMPVRRARVDDAAGIAGVHVETWRAAYNKVFPADFLDSLQVEERRGVWENLINRGSDVHVSVDEVVTGFCSVGPARGEEDWGELYAIYVHPDRWGSTDGFELLRAAEDQLRASGFKRALLWVLRDNPRARSFYERNGWTLAKPFRVEEIGGVQVTECRYEKDLREVG